MSWSSVPGNPSTLTQDPAGPDNPSCRLRFDRLDPTLKVFRHRPDSRDPSPYYPRRVVSLLLHPFPGPRTLSRSLAPGQGHHATLTRATDGTRTRPPGPGPSRGPPPTSGLLVPQSDRMGRWADPPEVHRGRRDDGVWFDVRPEDPDRWFPETQGRTGGAGGSAWAWKNRGQSRRKTSNTIVMNRMHE